TERSVAELAAWRRRQHAPHRPHLVEAGIVAREHLPPHFLDWLLGHRCGPYLRSAGLTFRAFDRRRGVSHAVVAEGLAVGLTLVGSLRVVGFRGRVVVARSYSASRGSFGSVVSGGSGAGSASRSSSGSAGEAVT